MTRDHYVRAGRATNVIPLLLLLLAIVLLPKNVAASDRRTHPPAHPPLQNGPVATHIVVRVVAHGAMVLGQDVGGARVTITDVETSRLLASGIQHGEEGDQNQIMRTPHLMEEPLYTSVPSAAFRATLPLERPTRVEIAAQGPLAYPSAMQRATKTVLLIPGHDLRSDGIVIDLSGYIVEIRQPPPGKPVIAKDDLRLVASVRTLSGSFVRPYGDWDSREIGIYGEIMIGDRIVERLQMFYSGEKSDFEASFFVPTRNRAPDGLTLRVVAADGARGNFGVGTATYPVLPEEAILRKKGLLKR